MHDVHFPPEAAADLTLLDMPHVQRVFAKLRRPAENLDDVRPEPLAGQWKGSSNSVWATFGYCPRLTR